jgi:hypothetical protein
MLNGRLVNCCPPNVNALIISGVLIVQKQIVAPVTISPA